MEVFFFSLTEIKIFNIFIEFFEKPIKSMKFFSYFLWIYLFVRKNIYYLQLIRQIYLLQNFIYLF